MCVYVSYVISMCTHRHIVLFAPLFVNFLATYQHTMNTQNFPWNACTVLPLPTFPETTVLWGWNPRTQASFPGSAGWAQQLQPTRGATRWEAG